MRAVVDELVGIVIVNAEDVLSDPKSNTAIDLLLWLEL
jgi:hypothetical protein